MSEAKISPKFTVVTSLIDIGRGKWSDYQRSIEFYLNYLHYLLKFDCNFYIYIEEENHEAIKKMRQDLLDKTVIKIIKLEDLDMYQGHDQIKEIMSDEKYAQDQSDKVCPELTKPLYNVVVNSKVELIYKASLENPFKSDYFIWLDAGYGHGKFNLTSEHQFDPFKLDISPDKITLLCLRSVDEIDPDYVKFFKKHVDVVNGGFFVVPKDLVKEYYHHYYDTVSKAFDFGITDDDQYNVSMSYIEKPDMFSIIYSSDWYYIINYCVTRKRSDSKALTSSDYLIQH